MAPPLASKTVMRSSTERPSSHVSMLKPLNTSSAPASASTVVQSPSKQISAEEALLPGMCAPRKWLLGLSSVMESRVEDVRMSRDGR